MRNRRRVGGGGCDNNKVKGGLIDKARSEPGPVGSRCLEEPEGDWAKVLRSGYLGNSPCGCNRVREGGEKVPNSER